MWVTFGHLRPSGHIMPDHAGDRGAVLLVLAPHDHLHIKHRSLDMTLRYAKIASRTAADECFAVTGKADAPLRPGARAARRRDRAENGPAAPRAPPDAKVSGTG
jgi:hypothetical protein